MEELRFPIGRFVNPTSTSIEEVKQWNAIIKTFPSLVEDICKQATEQQLDTPYRPEGWTVRQVVHHCADSHMNSFCRLKFTLTESNPVIKPYIEQKWAEGTDYKLPVDASIAILKGVHQRYAAIVEQLDEKQLQRTFVHPEAGETYTIALYTAIVAWHCQHHLAHMKLVVK